MPATFFDLLKEGKDCLAKAGLDEPRWEAELLLAGALRTDRLRLYIRLREAVPEEQCRKIRRLFEARAARVPLQHLTGVQEFWGLPIEVTPAVLIPRPETEILVEEAVNRLKGKKHAASPLLLDIGTGSGCIAVALAKELPGLRATGIDSSGEALAVARRNARRLGVARQVCFVRGDLLGPVKAGRADLIACNLPYIPSGELKTLQPEVRDHEPALALDGGADGMDLCRRLLSEAPDYLKPEGELLMEVGCGQAAPLTRWISHSGLPWKVASIKDLSGIERVLCLSRRPSRERRAGDG